MEHITKNEAVLLDITPSNHEFPFSFSNTQFLKKPNDKEIAALTFQARSCTLPLLLSLSADGYSFCCGVFKNDERASLNLIKQQIFCVDFDAGMSLIQAGEILQEHGFGFHGGYYTFNHSDSLEKFRLVFVFNGEIQSPEIVKDINLGFHYLFNCKTIKDVLMQRVFGLVLIKVISPAVPMNLLT